ncbi:Mannosyl-3-phosphoglycerate phosphatase [Polaromonas vacuolata]|uniref:Mannosyl-3-phosphoglycerate phosphatase n=1 Tax=Polaromonas vacuolata TaxID=37448 RepID=A0A6H2HE76_9BURK|nr:HAD-IIB family hydrolase [Polaromonas vacuolata]QJC57766.1 Mannosyl-3-phosphoglycerate phosphatase [Polaromonas vacuolata]
MQALVNWPLETRRKITGVFTDIDDTLTTEGVITPDALAALSALKTAGVEVIAITGRPVGWSEPFARSWPVNAIVAENGAVIITAAADTGITKVYQQSAAMRAQNFARMQQVLKEIERDIPGAKRATDSAGRETDIAIDHSEFAQLDQAQIEAVLKRMQSCGLQASVSSIHINAWYGQHNKLQGAHWVVEKLLQRRLASEMDNWVFVGDSTNDQLMFGAFNSSMGVANIARFVPQLTHLPRYVTTGERGAGFAQMVTQLLAARETHNTH